MSVPGAREVLLVTNQGGQRPLELMVAHAEELGRLLPGATRRMAVLTAAEAAWVRQNAPGIDVESFEEHRARNGDYGLEAERDRLLRDYPGVNWAEVLISERSFFDPSNLEGGAGERRVGKDYVERLLVEFVRFFESRLASRPDLVVTFTPDTLMTLVLYKVTRGRGVPIRGLSPAWITPGRIPGGFLTEDEFLHGPAMLRGEATRHGRALTAAEIARAEAFRAEITAFDANAVYKVVTGVSFGRSALSPNVKRLLGYITSNAQRRPEIEYYKIDPAAKLLANLRRVWRKRRAAPLLGPTTVNVPPRSVLFPMHFQPEASTLVGGIFHADQAALGQAILKSLPLGWSLVVKEHPAGRGTRPLSQYRRLLGYPNVVFCDAPSKAILPHVDAVVTVTGTVGIEALAMDKPVVMMGRWFWDHCPLVYRANGAEELPAIFRRILVDRHYEMRRDRDDLIRRFLLGYLDAILPAVPQSGDVVYARALVDEMDRLSRDEKAA